MNKIKEMIGNITKRAWIISGGVLVLVLIIAGLTIWPLSLFKKEVAEEVNSEEKNTENQLVSEAFTKENIKRGEYKNDNSSATLYVKSTQEVQIAVVADAKAQRVLEDTTKVSCGNIAFVTYRVVGPAVLTNSLKALFEGKVDADFVPGNIIPTYHPELTLENVVVDNGIAKIYLGGNFNGERDGWCDASLAIAQITETAKTFPNVTSVEVYQGEKKIY
jgi:Sporulation and spore germination